MDHRPFLDFCAAVTRQLRCRWEAEDVYQELYDHLQDHADALEERGLPPEEAQLQAVAAMGDPVELGRALDRLHSPWPWRILIVCRRCLWAALALVLVLLLRGLLERDLPSAQLFPTVSLDAAAQDLLLGEDWAEEVLRSGSVTGGGRLGDYLLRPQGEAILTHRPDATFADGSIYPGGCRLAFLVETAHWQPWLEDVDVPWYALSATDDLGNAYGPEDMALTAQSTGGRLLGRQVCSLYDVDPAARRFTVVLSAAGERAAFTVTLEEGGDLP